MDHSRALNEDLVAQDVDVVVAKGEAPIRSIAARNALSMAAKKEEQQQQLSPHDQWEWNKAHWKNWHGIWALWHPQKSREISKRYRVVRALRADDDEGRRLHHRNQWFSSTGPGGAMGWENGPWIMTEEGHSLPDGIVHPNKDDFRMLVFPNGDLGWLQLELKPNDPKCFGFGEVHFMLPGKEGRIPIILGYGEGGVIGAAQMLEEARDTDEKPDASWHGSVFQHYESAQLEPSREEPQGEFVGEEMVITATLMMTTSSGSVWPGFCVGDGDTAVHLPLGFTGVLPSEPAIGKEHEWKVHWLVSDSDVRMISWKYDQYGKLTHIKSGSYSRKH